jgi:hypothetical protein
MASVGWYASLSITRSSKPYPLKTEEPRVSILKTIKA